MRFFSAATVKLKAIKTSALKKNNQVKKCITDVNAATKKVWQNLVKKASDKKLSWQKIRASLPPLKKFSGIGAFSLLTLFALFGAAKLVVYTPERGQPRVVFNIAAAQGAEAKQAVADRVVVYPVQKVVYYEQAGHSYYLVDYKRQRTAEGVLFSAPAFLTGEVSGRGYSVKLWRAFGQAADAPQHEVNVKEYEKYLLRAVKIYTDQQKNKLAPAQNAPIS